MNSWSVATDWLRVQAREAYYYRELSFNKRIQFVHTYKLPQTFTHHPFKAVPYLRRLPFTLSKQCHNSDGYPSPFQSSAIPQTFTLHPFKAVPCLRQLPFTIYRAVPWLRRLFLAVTAWHYPTTVYVELVVDDVALGHSFLRKLCIFLLASFHSQ